MKLPTQCIRIIVNEQYIFRNDLLRTVYIVYKLIVNVR